MRIEHWLYTVPLRFRSLFRGRRVEQELDDELRDHLDRLIDAYVAKGLTPEEARYAALRAIDGIALCKEQCRDTRRVHVIDDLLKDLRYAVRILRRSPGFTAVAILSLALGIGANTAIFQLLDAARLRTLPINKPQELAEVRVTNATSLPGLIRGRYGRLSNPLWEQIRDRQRAFAGIFAWGTDVFNLNAGGEARYAQALWVSGDFFQVLGVPPLMGRVFTAADDSRGCGAPGAVISYQFWQRELGGDRSAIGRKITLEGHPFDVIGVTPASFFGVEVGRSFDVALPICAEPIIRESSSLDVRWIFGLTVMGRLEPGWSLEQATAQLASVSPGIFEATLHPGYNAQIAKRYLAFRLGALPAGSGVSSLRRQYQTPLVLLLVIAALVLLIACANLANLMLARASARAREIAVRLSLGASRGRLLRQLLTESLLLAIGGAAAGAFLARALSQFLVSFLSTGRDPLFVDLHVDWRVLAFTAAVTMLTCVVFGLTPALRATRIAPGPVLKAGSRGVTASRERFGLRRSLVVSQVAVSLVLLVGALLFLRSLSNLLTLETGFQQAGVVKVDLDLTRLNIPRERRDGFKRELLERVRATPGVDGAADAGVVPVIGGAWTQAVYREGADSTQAVGSYFNPISPGYFKTLRIPMLAGRDFDDRDARTSPLVAIVNESFARSVFNGANPVGRTFRMELGPGAAKPFEIVGLAKDTKYKDLREDFRPIAFLVESQMDYPGPSAQLLIRSSTPLAGLTSAVKHTIGEISSDISIDFRVLETGILEELMRERLMATLSGFFGLLALVLVCIGLYGLLSYNVAGRTNEIGIRLALGATRGSVVGLVLRECASLMIAGLALGVPATLGATRVISTLLFGVGAGDLLTIAGAVLMMIAVAALAGFLPARRASRVDPMVALRCE